MKMRFKLSLCILGAFGARYGCVSQTLQAAPSAKGRKITPTGKTSFTSQTRQFSVWLPAPPTESSEGWFIGPNDVPPNSFRFDTFVKPISYNIKVTPNPTNAAPSNPKKELDRIQQRLLHNPSDKFLKQEDLQFSNFPGRDLQASWADGQRLIRARLYITPKNLYEIVVSGPKAEMKKQNAQIESVLDSFRILPQ